MIQVIGFNFKQIVVYPSSYIVGQSAQYSFEMHRYEDNGFIPTAWATNPVSTTAQITLTFPTANYALNAISSAIITSISVNSIAVTASISSIAANKVTIINAFSALTGDDLKVRQVDFVLANIINPKPAVFTDTFQGTIGVDVSQPNSGGIQFQPANMQSCSITFNPAFVNKAASMIVTVDPTNILDSTASIQVQMPLTRRWSNKIDTTATIPVLQGTMSCNKQSGDILNTPICTGSLGTFIITATNILGTGITTANSFSYSISSLTTPPTLQPSDLITISSFINGIQLQSCSVYPSGLVVNQFNSLTISSIQQMQVNHQIGLRISMNLSDSMDTYDSIRIVFPAGLAISFANISGTGPFDNALHSVTGQTLNVGLRSSVTRIYTANQEFIINFYNFTAPPSTVVTNNIVVSVLRNGFGKMSGQTTVQALPAALTGTATAVTTTVWAISSYKINIILADGLTSTGYIQIFFPPTITPTVTPNCATLIGTGVVNTPTCTYDSTLHKITISNMVSGTTAISPQTLQFTLLSIRNAPSISPSSSFTIKSYYTSQTDSLVATGTITGITATVGTIQSSTASIVPLSDVVYQSSVTYTFNLVTTYQIPQGGSIRIKIPNNNIQVTVGGVSTRCKLSVAGGGFGATTCTAQTLVSQYQIRFTNPAAAAAIAAGSTVAMRVQEQMRNPVDTGTVSGFTYEIFHSDGYLTSQLLTGLSMQVSTPSPLQSTDITSSSTTNSQLPTTYTFTLSQLPPLPPSSKLIITLPSSLKLTSASSSSCQYLDNTPLTCTYSTVSSRHVLKVTLPATAITSLTPFGIKVGQIRNLPSFAPYTQSFMILTKSNSELVSYASGSDMPTFRNTQTSAFASIVGVYGSQILGAATTLQVTLTPSGYTVPSYVKVNLASSFVIDAAGLSCTSATCVYNPAISHQITVTGINSIAQLVFTINGLRSPTTAPTDKTTITSFTSANYQIDSDQSIQFTIICTLPCRTCTTGSPTACLSCYTNTAISTFIYYNDPQDLCYQTCPATTYTNTVTFRCLPCDSNCLQCLNTATNCIKCDTGGAVPYLNIVAGVGQCVASCGDFRYIDTALVPVQCVVCGNLDRLCDRCTDAGVCTSCGDVVEVDATTTVGYFYNGQCFDDPANCPVGTTIPNAGLNLCQPCASVCLTCSVTINNCLSCAAGTAQHQGSCVSQCPSPLVIKNGVCQTCSTICDQCSITYDNCTSCDTTTANKYLYNFDCLTQCPQLHYQDPVLGLCPACPTNIGCVNCTTSSTCGTCDSGYIFHSVDSKCYLTAPTGYVNISGQTYACNGQCATCQNTIYNCTSCRTQLLQGNDCQPACNPGFVSLNGICSQCTSNCSTCTNLQNNCTSCLDTTIPQVFLTNYQCLQTCPDFTYPNSNTNICEGCVSPCQKCTSLTSCVTCRQNFYLQDSINCVTAAQCRNGYIGISRVCTRCTSPCDYCSGTLTHCTKCLDGFYLVLATNKCQNPCPVGLYPNAANQCTGCTDPCDTCEVTAEKCTSCLNNLFLLDNQCISVCPDGYYGLNSRCVGCSTGCARCTSATVCVSCHITHSLYINNCVESCPSTHPVIKNGACTQCTDSNCLICDSLDQCSSCKYPTLLHFGSCLSTCPTNYTSNVTHCNYNPITQPIIDQTNTTANQTLNETLASPNIFPVPFTIGGTFIGIACLMSKFQHSHTFIAGALYSLLSVLQWGSWGVALYFYFMRVSTEFSFTFTYIQVLIFLGALAFFYLLNVLAVFVQNCFLRTDAVFKKWQNKQSANFCWYCASSVIGLVMTHKFKNILFCKLFGFDVFKARLQDVQNFKIFNIFSFLSFIPSAGILVATSFMIKNYHIPDQQLMAYIDVLVLTVICIILAIFTSIKNSQFFSEKDQDGYVVNKRINQSQTLMNEAIVPMMMQQAQSHQGGNMNRNIFDTERKFRVPSEQTYTEEEPTPSIHVQDISIQAAPILQDYSKIDFYDDRELSSFTMFDKKDVSMNVSHRAVENQEVSVQHQPNIFEQEDRSIQNNPLQEDYSIQKQVSHADMSLQHVPKQNQMGMQMSREEADYSIQAAVKYDDASVQYSAKPVFENISKDLDDGSDQSEQQIQSRDLKEIGNNQTQGEQVPVKNERGLQAQLELDVDDRLRQKQEEIEMEKEEQRQKQKEDLIKAFHRERQQKRSNERQPKIEKDDEAGEINKMFNNQDSKLGDSSLIGSSSNEIIHFKSKKLKTQSKQSQQLHNEDKSKSHNRINTQKTQKQFLDLLNKPEDFEEISLNVTDDLEKSDHKEFKVKYQQNNINVDSGDEEIMQIEQQKQRYPSNKILKNDMILEELPSADKSRSTNFLSTVRDRRRLHAHSLQSSKYSDELGDSGAIDEDDPIVDGPLDYRRKKKLANFRQQKINYEPRAKMVHNDKRNSISAQLGGRNNPKSSQLDPVKDARQQALPEIKRLKSQQSNGSDQQNSYKVNPKKILLQGNKLEFDDDDRYMETQQQQFPTRHLPRVLKSESNLKKQNSKSKLGDRVVTREILGGDNYHKQLQKQSKKNQNYRAQMQEIEARLERHDVNERKHYRQDTYASKERKKSSLQKVYKNNPYDKKY